MKSVFLNGFSGKCVVLGLDVGKAADSKFFERLGSTNFEKKNKNV